MIEEQAKRFADREVLGPEFVRAEGDLSNNPVPPPVLGCVTCSVLGHECSRCSRLVAQRERDDANRALEMERAAHRATAERAERFGGALSAVKAALEELPDTEGARTALRVARKALVDG